MENLNLNSEQAYANYIVGVAVKLAANTLDRFVEKVTEYQEAGKSIDEFIEASTKLSDASNRMVILAKGKDMTPIEKLDLATKLSSLLLEARF